MENISIFREIYGKKIPVIPGNPVICVFAGSFQ
jgi:hypothetical protein